MRKKESEDFMIKVGSKVNLIKTCNLISDKKKMIEVSKKNPLKGSITYMKGKMVAGNKVTMCGFHPDKFPDDYVYSFGLKSFEEIKV